MVQCNNWKTKMNLQKYACNWLFNAIAKEKRNCSSSQLQTRLEIVFNEFEKRLEMCGSMQITKLIGNFCSKFKGFIVKDI